MSSTYESNATWGELADRVRRAQHIAIVTHARPDGDALGSVLALVRALAPFGKRARGLLMGPIEPALLGLIGDTPVTRLEEPPAADDDPDLVIVVDTGAWAQLEPLGPWLRRLHDRVIGLDHHANGDDVADQRMVDPGAAAAAQLVLDLLDELGCPLTGGAGSVAEALYVGLATDTGWFRYSNADAEAFAVAARLMRTGVDHTRLYQRIEETFGPERLALEARALASVEYARDGTVAIQSLRPSDFTETETSVEHLTGIVNAPMVVGAVRVSILLTEIDPGTTKMSFRAKPAADDGPAWDVNELAGRFGGGGHVFAAGARMAGSLDETRQALLDALGDG